MAIYFLQVIPETNSSDICGPSCNEDKEEEAKKKRRRRLSLKKRNENHVNASKASNTENQK